MKMLIAKDMLTATIPEYKSSGAAGMDLHSAVYAVLLPGARKLINTGLKIAIPEGYEGQIRPRSGIANDYGVTVLNSPGTIDSDYRGQIKILLINHGDTVFTVNIGDRIAQMVFTKVEQVEFVEGEILGDTVRNEGGFGHTGSN